MTGSAIIQRGVSLMASVHEEFWTHQTYAVVGHSAQRKFPVLTYRALKAGHKTVYAIDPSSGDVDGDKAYPDFKYLPRTPDGVILELPKEETAKWVRAAAAAGIKNLWLHQRTETPEALAVAKAAHMNVCTGTCAVMYNVSGISAHTIHRWIRQAANRY